MQGQRRMLRAAHDPTIRQLLAGIKGFRARYYERRPDSMRQLVEEGQKPQVLMIGCSDSRVDPALLTQAEPGELFVVRNVANLVPPYQPDGAYHGTSAAIEYAVRVLNVGHVIVLGHAFCGGIQGLIRLRAGNPDGNDFVAPWVSIASAALAPYVSPSDANADLERLLQRPAVVERAAVQTSVDNLMTFPFVRDRVEAGTLQLHGWWFDLETGDLWAIDPQTATFRPVE
ncbi:carbonic anhydrase [Azospirillum rugosum]|uniref:Carbonic anhydrase n=1 Tax=Azospirillum rugosum TaxID=416170 RepID=A0ABS4SP55_9PROT|nr:carbonic anhydrase [Azospirillum rugosum]MBP2294339.1 carbonic anhydrase [Azospirillum rugosum]MDQ0527674.1 carbonic anhydrase [Azospirillum rugosum]